MHYFTLAEAIVGVRIPYIGTAVEDDGASNATLNCEFINLNSQITVFGSALDLLCSIEADVANVKLAEQGAHQQIAQFGSWRRIAITGAILALYEIQYALFSFSEKLKDEGYRVRLRADRSKIDDAQTAFNRRFPQARDVHDALCRDCKRARSLHEGAARDHLAPVDENPITLFQWDEGVVTVGTFGGRTVECDLKDNAFDTLGEVADLALEAFRGRKVPLHVG